MICSSGEMSCCQMKSEKAASEKKSCCEEKKEIKFSSNCMCIIKEATKEPAELSHSFHVNIKNDNPNDLYFGEVSQLSLNKKNYSNSFINTFHSPPNEDINLLKCVLRI